jgi:hypothetical protein
MGAQYPVICACGRTHQVSGGEAGSRLSCGCGRTVEVPDLRTLRMAAGEPTIPPELAIEAMLQAGQVPGSEECVGCGAPTADVCHVLVQCERREWRAGGWKVNPIYWLFGVFYAERTEARELGRNVAYQLPVRMCSPCARRLSRSRTREALHKVNEYHQLLAKYPHASVARPEC